MRTVSIRPAASCRGRPFPVADKIVMGRVAGTSVAAVSVAASGQIVYRTGGEAQRRQFAWFDRSGRPLGTVGEPDPSYALSPSLSPDGRRLAMHRFVAGNTDIWILELARGALSRFTTHPANEIFPIWSPDGRRILFSSNRGGAYALYEKATDGTADERLVLAKGAQPNDWSRDGSLLLFQQRDLKTAADLWVLPIGRGQEPSPVVRTDFDERGGQFSPDATLDRLCLDRVGPLRGLPAAVSGPGSEAADLGRRRRAGALASRRQGAVLHRARRSADGGAGRAACGRRAGQSRHGRSAVPDSRGGRPAGHLGTAVLRVAGRPALPDEHAPRRRPCVPDHADPELEAAAGWLERVTTGAALETRIDALPEPQALAAFLRCCGSRRWAEAMVRGRPYGDERALLAAAERAFAPLSARGLARGLLAPPAHRRPRLARRALPARPPAGPRPSRAASPAPARTCSTRCFEANRDYEARFGHIFIVCATGKSAAEMLALLRERLPNEPDAELEIAAAEQRKITAIRLKKLLVGGSLK